MVDMARIHAFQSRREQPLIGDEQWTEIDIAHIGVCQPRILHIDAAEIGARELRSAQIRAFQLCALQTRSGKVEAMRIWRPARSTPVSTACAKPLSVRRSMPEDRQARPPRPDVSAQRACAASTTSIGSCRSVIAFPAGASVEHAGHVMPSRLAKSRLGADQHRAFQIRARKVAARMIRAAPDWRRSICAAAGDWRASICIRA